MKKSLKGLILASLISTQVLTAPISAFATTEEQPVAISEATDTQTTESSENVVGTTSEETETTASSEATETSESAGDTEQAAPAPTESSTTPPATSEPAASEANKTALRTMIDQAIQVMTLGNYTETTKAALQQAISTGEALLASTAATDQELLAAIAEINAKMNALVENTDEEIALVNSLESWIENAQVFLGRITNNPEGYTTASVAAKKANMEAAINSGKAVLNLVKDSYGNIDGQLAVSNRAAVENAINIVKTACYYDGLIDRTPMVAILEEAANLKGSKVSEQYLKDKNVFEAAVSKAVDAYENALTDEEIYSAVIGLRSAMENLHLLVVVSAVDENGNLIMDQKDTSLIGLYKGSWNVTPPTIEGYEYVSANNKELESTLSDSNATLSGTFGDGTNDVTLVYRKTDKGTTSTYYDPSYSNNYVNDPAKVSTTNNKDTQYQSKRNLPKTGEETSGLASLGFITLTAGALLIFKKRKIEG
jgi:LPXTG-motif cell wall-anchored protein